MLSRTAENLFWMARNMERAENTARMLDVSFRMALLPSTIDKQALHFEPILAIAPGDGRFGELYGELTHETIMRYVALEPDNARLDLVADPLARENARAQRSAISSEAWESLNSTWLQVQNLDFEGLTRWGYRDFFDWVKERSHLFRGVVFGTMLHDDAFRFIRLGTFIERADNTARILDVKYHVLLPETEQVGGYVDYYQWGALLRSVGAFRAYRRVYHDTVYPWRIAELADPARRHAALAASLLRGADRHARRACRQEAARMPAAGRPDLRAAADMAASTRSSSPACTSS